MRNFSTEGVHFRKLLHPLEILLNLGVVAKNSPTTVGEFYI